MAAHQFFTERKNLHVGSSVKLPSAEGEHIRKSLRMQPGDKIVLFNGLRKYDAQLTMVTKDTVLAEITENRAEEEPAARQQLTLIQSLVRAANFELVIQKATELGVDNIIPLQTEFSQIKLERMETKQARWEKIALEACKQSERTTIPQVYPAMDFAELHSKEVLSEFDLALFLAVPREIVSKIDTVKPISSYIKQLQQARHIALLVGPEGGFSPTEHQLARKWGLPFVSMGENVLKAETAGIAATAFVQLLRS